MRPRTLASFILLVSCCTLPAAAAPNDQSYRARGTEPSWSVELDGRRMTFTEASTADKPVVQPQPAPRRSAIGRTYRSGRIVLTVFEGQTCSDNMSDRVFSDRVRVRVDGRNYQGCGGEPMAPRTLANTNWTVESINNRKTSGGDKFAVQFEADRMSGAFGCNRVFGSYQYDGKTLTAGQLGMTQMACDDMKFEQEASSILEHPTHATWSEGRLTLSNEAGTIVLRQLI